MVSSFFQNQLGSTRQDPYQKNRTVMLQIITHPSDFTSCTKIKKIIHCSNSKEILYVIFLVKENFFVLIHTSATHRKRMFITRAFSESHKATVSLSAFHTHSCEVTLLGHNGVKPKTAVPLPILCVEYHYIYHHNSITEI